MLRKGYFKRIDPTPYKVRLDLSGPVTIVNQGEVIFAEVSTFKDVVGFVFVGWNQPAKVDEPISTDPLNPSQIDGFKNMVVVQATKQVAPHKLFLENLKKDKEKEPTEVKFVEDIVVPIEPVPVLTKAPENKENDKKALVEYLKKFDNKKWFVMKKEDARDFLDRLEINRDNLPNSKNEFIKCLRDYIKSVS